MTFRQLIADELSLYLARNHLCLDYAEAAPYLRAGDWLVVGASEADCPPHHLFTFELLQQLSPLKTLLVARQCNVEPDALEIVPGIELILHGPCESCAR